MAHAFDEFNSSICRYCVHRIDALETSEGLGGKAAGYECEGESAKAAGSAAAKTHNAEAQPKDGLRFGSISLSVPEVSLTSFPHSLPAVFRQR